MKEKSNITHHIIYWNGKWRVIKSQAKRALRKFTYREQAYHHAMLLSNHVVVHNENGSVHFTSYTKQ